MEKLFDADSEAAASIATELADHALQALSSPETLQNSEIEALTRSEHRWLSIASLSARKSYRVTDAVRLFERLALNSISTPEEQVTALASAGSICASQCLWVETRSYLERGISVAQSNRLPGLESRLLSELSNMYATLGQRAAMTAALERQRSLAVESGEPFPVALCHIQMGTAEQSAGNFLAAESEYHKAMTLIESSRYSYFRYRLMGNIANCLRDRGQYEQAEKLYAQALTGHELRGDLEALANDTGNLGSSFRLQGRLDEALAQYERAINLLRPTPFRGKEGIYWHNLGMVRSAQGRFHEATQAYTTAITNLIAGFQFANACLARCYMAAILQRQGDELAARHHIENAHNMWREAGSRDIDALTQEALHKERQRWPQGASTG
ncbi:hypothetical protein PLCT2_01432 [Planctomycetaceae bacterium]|nr:hypothetical protein PLCT2_01432 [Planctomycetaceae bacterium]